MQKELEESAPLLDEAGDLWISRKWLREVMPDLKPSEFMYLVFSRAGVKGFQATDTTKYRIAATLRGKGML